MDTGEGWYQRRERNEWRSVTMDTLRDADRTPEERAKEDLAKRFHYSKQRRAVDRQVAMKHRRRKWMMQM